ncbi:hypothetical protein FIBSPDRAFT_886754 [Athelia psychrophila]|uniref:Nephrocystin 3-like N-terminal domain-containing protein n=1 Tax=Athelia psychrophila TaxID=1759441 RepID=A0A166QHV2_9AGAM|nr:hypothetical protein FIBSPDRAFT_886754 [Fibularhizoctonia sp. CBS 109695]
MSPESEPPLVAYTLQIISADDLPLRHLTFLGERDVIAKATVEDCSVQTKACMCSSSAEWKQTFQISKRRAELHDACSEARKPSSIMSLQLSRPTRGPSLNCGAEIVISDLLVRCRYGQDAEMDLRGTKSGLQGRIKIRLSLPQNGSWSADEAQKLALVLSQQPNTAMAATGGCIDAVDGLLTISFPTPPAGASESIQNVLGKLENFMRIADAVAEVWLPSGNVRDVRSSICEGGLGSAIRGSQAQVAIDQSVADLFQTMQDVYGFVDAIKAVPSKIQHLEKIIQRILIQTAECGNLIREYSGHGFGGRLLRETMGASTPAKVAEMAQSLTTLHDQFNTGVVVHIAVVCFRIQTDVATLAENQALDRLGSSGVDLGDFPCCLPGTRRDVVDEILGWASNPSHGDGDNVLWLYGPAGTGKSAVAATVATHFSEMGRLGAFVGFDQASPEQSRPSTAVKSLARQLAEYDGRLRTSITQTINDGPKASVLRASLSDKFDRLIVKPLASIPTLPGEGPIVVVIDGLYQYEQPGGWASLLDLLVRGTKSLPSNLRFIITSRTVNGILDAVTGTALHPRIKSYELRSSSQPDIFDYFTFRMEQIRRKNTDLQQDWPRRAAIVELTARACGFFAWAVDASNFVDAYCPPERLNRERCARDIWYFERGAGPAILCLQRMGAVLKRNMCNMALSARLSTEVLPEELAYACQSWVDHICTDGTFGSWAMEKLVVFLRTHLLHWFEAMSILKKSGEIAPMLQRVATWLEENTFEDKSLKDFVIEAIDFARRFDADIAEHPLYVYYTAIPLLSSHSMLYRLFHDSLVDTSVMCMQHGPLESIRCMALSADGLRLVTGYKDLTVWDTANGEKLLTIKNPSRSYLDSAAFSHDALCIACGTSDSTVYVWDSVSGAQVIGPLSHSEPGKFMYSVAWCTGGERLLSGCRTGEVILWDVASPKGNCQPIITIHHPGCTWEKPLRSVAISSDGSQITSCSEQGDVYVWDSETGGDVWSIQDPRGYDPSISISFLSSDMGTFLVVKTKERTQAHDTSTGNPCPLPDSLAGAVGLTHGNFMVNFLTQSMKKHHGINEESLWVAQGEYFAFSGHRNRCHVLMLDGVGETKQLQLGLAPDFGHPDVIVQSAMTTHGIPAKLTTTNRCTSRPLCDILLKGSFNSIVLFPLCAVLLYSSVHSSNPSSLLSAAFPARDKVVFNDVSSAKNVCSVHQFGKTPVTRRFRRAVTTMRWVPLYTLPALCARRYAPHYASNHLAFFQPEIHEFTQGLSKTLDSKTPVDCLLLSCRFFWERSSDIGIRTRIPSPQCLFLLFTSITPSNWLSISQIMAEAKCSASESMPDRDIISEVMAHIVAGIDTTTISLSYFLRDERRLDTIAKLQAGLDPAMTDPLLITNITAPQNLPYSASSLPHLQNGSRESFDPMGDALPASTVIAIWACFMNSRPRRIPPAAHPPPQPVALRDRGPTRADAGTFLAFPHGIVDLWEHGACDDNDAHYLPGTLRSTRRKGRWEEYGPEE